MMKNIYSSHIEGAKLTGKKASVSGIVYHNDYGTLTPSQYLSWLYQRERNGEYVKGWASVYANKDECLWYHPTDYVEWHCGHAWANANLIGIEICQSHPNARLTDAQFILNEEACFKIGAEILKSYGLPVNRNTVNLHREYFATACPHRSWDIHVGKNAPNTRKNQLKLLDYFIARTKYYYNGGDKKAKPKPQAKPKPVTYKVKKGDSLWGIAKKHKVTVSQIKKLNALKSDAIFPNQILFIKK